MRYLQPILLALIACLVPVQPAVASQVTYHPGVPGIESAWAVYVLDFAAFPLGQRTTFSETVGDLIVTYTAAGDPSAFRTVNSGDVPATPSPFPVLLGEAGSSVLGISFSRSVYGIALEYVTLGSGPIQMDLLSGGLGGSIVGTVTGTGTVPPGLIYPEGILNLLPACVCDNYFDAVRLSDFTDPSFAVRRTIVAENLPEPPMLAILGIGLAVLVTLRRLSPFGAGTT